MRVLGIDPGTWTTGYGLLAADRSITVIDWGAISFKRSRKGDSDTGLERRLHHIYVALSDLIEREGPEEVAVEDPFLGRGARTFPTTAIAIGQAQAAAFMAAARFELPIYRYSPAEVKLAVADYGRATKEQVQELLARQLGMQPTFDQPDAADALAAALCHVRRRHSDDVVYQQASSGWPGF